MASSPKPPDYNQMYNLQSNANMNAAYTNAIMGNANETNPYGSVNYSVAGYEPIYNAQGQVTGQAPRWNRNVTFSPQQQKLYNLQTQAQQNLGQLAVQQSGNLQKVLGKTLDTKGLPGWQQYQKADPYRRDETPTDRPAIEAAMMGRYNEDAARQAQQQDAQLAARGMSPGSAQAGFVQEGRDRARTDALRQAYLASGQESRQAQQAYNQAVTDEFNANNTWTSAQNALRGQELQERQTLQSFPVNLITALMSGSQVTAPSFAPYNAPSVQSVPVAQYAYDQYNADAQRAAQQNQGIFGLAGGLGKLLLGGMTGGAGSAFSFA